MASHGGLEHKPPERVQEALFGLRCATILSIGTFPLDTIEMESCFAPGCKLIAIVRSGKDISEPVELRNASWLAQPKGAIDLK